MPRKPKRNANSSSNLATPAPTPATSQPTQNKSWAKRLNEQSHHFSNWAQFGGFLVALLALGLSSYFQWLQIQDLKEGKSESDSQLKLFAKQIDDLKTSNEKNRELQILPRLLVECPTEKIDLTSAGHLLTDGHIRIKNIGRGTALNVVATVAFTSLKVGATPVTLEDNGLQNDTPLVQQTIPAGESRRFDEFDYPLAKEATDPQGLQGIIATFCMNEDGKDFIVTQDFYFLVHLEKDRPHAHLVFKTPIRHEYVRIREEARTSDGIKTTLKQIMQEMTVEREKRKENT